MAATLAPTTTTTAAFRTTTAPSATTTTISAEPSHAGYEAAKQEWLLAPSVDGTVNQDLPLAKAIADLNSGLETDGNTVGYAAAISELKNLSEIPDSGVTPAERALANRYIKSLNTFFGTPNLWS
jgi:hypothetical protein